MSLVLSGCQSHHGTDRGTQRFKFGVTQRFTLPVALLHGCGQGCPRDCLPNRKSYAELVQRGSNLLRHLVLASTQLDLDDVLDEIAPSQLLAQLETGALLIVVPVRSDARLVVRPELRVVCRKIALGLQQHTT